MMKSYIPCPYGCMHDNKPREITVSGMTMHIKQKHPEKYDEFKAKFAELKKSAIKKETTFVPAEEKKPPQEPPKIETPAPKEAPKIEPPKEDRKEGEKKPAEGKSFLDEFTDWLGSPEF